MTRLWRCAGVAVAGAIIFATGRYQWLDPTITLVICVLVVIAGAHLITKAIARQDFDFDDD